MLFQCHCYCLPAGGVREGASERVSPGKLVTAWSRIKSSTSSDLSRYWPLGLARRVAMRARRMLEPEKRERPSDDGSN